MKKWILAIVLMAQTNVYAQSTKEREEVVCDPNHHLTLSGVSAAVAGMAVIVDTVESQASKALVKLSKTAGKKGVVKQVGSKLKSNIIRLPMRTVAVGSAFMAGYSLGEAIVAVDKNRFDGRLVETTSRVLEPVFETVYQAQQELSGQQ